MRIAKAISQKRHSQARSLQWLLTHSRSAKLLAVQRVTQNKGAKTPGVDKKVWRTDRQKFNAVTNSNVAATSRNHCGGFTFKRKTENSGR